MSMSIKRTRDVKRNVSPMLLILYHAYSIEGRCRFENGSQPCGNDLKQVGKPDELLGLEGMEA